MFIKLVKFIMNNSILLPPFLSCGQPFQERHRIITEENSEDCLFREEIIHESSAKDKQNGNKLVTLFNLTIRKLHIVLG